MTTGRKFVYRKMPGEDFDFKRDSRTPEVFMVHNRRPSDNLVYMDLTEKISV
jgi:hypothetical protein